MSNYEFFDPKLTRVGERDENTRRMYNFLQRGPTQEEIEQAEQKRIEEERLMQEKYLKAQREGRLLLQSLAEQPPGEKEVDIEDLVERIKSQEDSGNE